VTVMGLQGICIASDGELSDRDGLAGNMTRESWA
jgi:hypothetical protein